MSKGLYAALGVSTGKEDVHAAITEEDPGLFPLAFCKVLPDVLTGDEDYCIVMHADGAGTFSALAYLAVAEGSPPGVMRHVANNALVMNIDDCACVGAVGPYLMSNAIGRNALRVSGGLIGEVIAGYRDLTEMLGRLGIDCHRAGGETADVGDLVRTIIADATVVTRFKREQVIDTSRIVAGDVIVGFSSTGQAAWEDEPNSGIGSNGLTLARHSALAAVYRRYEETYASELDRELAYAGPYLLSDLLPGDGRFTVGSALLSPTRTYVPLIKLLLQRLTPTQVHALIHCSGGGQSKIGKFGPPGLRFIKDNLFPVPPLFAMLKQVRGVSWEEMHRAYNMGHRLEAVVPADVVAICLEVAALCGIEARVVGRVEAWPEGGREVRIERSFCDPLVYGGG